MKDFFENRHGHQRVINIPNGVLDALFALKPEEKGFILFLGRIDMYMKGLDILIEAFSRVHDRDVSLKTAGSGKKAYVKRLGRAVRDYGLENRVEYLGRVKAEDKMGLLRTWLFLAMPSRFEGWGITAAEANATGKPVLGTKIWGPTEAIVDGSTGLLVEPGNAEQLKARMGLRLQFCGEIAITCRGKHQGFLSTRKPT